MPIAGNTLYSVQMCWRNGILSESGWMQRSAYLVEDDVAQALAKLREQEIVYVQVVGTMIPRLREALLGRIELWP